MVVGAEMNSAPATGAIQARSEVEEARGPGEARAGSRLAGVVEAVTVARRRQIFPCPRPADA